LLLNVCSAGIVAVAVGVLQQKLGIVLHTEQQLFAAFRTCCAQLTAAMPPTAGPQLTQQKLDPAVERSVAFNMFQDLHRIASSSSTSDTGNSSGGGDGGSSSSSGTKPLAFAMPKCGLDAAFEAIESFAGCIVRMAQCEGVYTKTDAMESSPFAALVNPEVAAQMADVLKACPEAAAVLAMMTAACKGSSAAQKADPDWGKGQGLAGLRGLFRKPAAADAAAGAKPAAVKANGSGVVVASSTAAAAPAAAAAAAVAQSSAASNKLAAAVAKKATSAAAAAVGGKAANAPAAALGEKAASAPAAAVGKLLKKAASAAAAPAGPGGGSKGSAKGAVSSSASGPTPPELLVEAFLKKWYCSPNTFDLEDVQVSLDHTLPGGVGYAQQAARYLCGGSSCLVCC
jgi:hypothetical protein